jgi:hypothetical protein
MNDGRPITWLLATEIGQFPDICVYPMSVCLSSEIDGVRQWPVVVHDMTRRNMTYNIARSGGNSIEK